jgi:hypothetical protein
MRTAKIPLADAAGIGRRASSNGHERCQSRCGPQACSVAEKRCTARTTSGTPDILEKNPAPNNCTEAGKPKLCVAVVLMECKCECT